MARIRIENVNRTVRCFGVKAREARLVWTERRDSELI